MFENLSDNIDKRLSSFLAMSRRDITQYPLLRVWYCDVLFTGGQ